MITIDLPYPAPELWPNKPAHWAVKRKATQKHREWAHMATLAETKDGFVPSAIKLVVYGKSRGPLPDRDNCNAAAKAFLDGVADALAVNDRDFPSVTVEFAKAREGRFVLLLSPPLCTELTAEDAVPLAVVLGESGPPDAINIQTGLTNNAKEIADGS